MVKHVIDAYYEAVLNHDGSRLASLFIPQGSMWLNVLSDDAYASESEIIGYAKDSRRELCRFHQSGFDRSPYRRSWSLRNKVERQPN